MNGLEVFCSLLKSQRKNMYLVKITPNEKMSYSFANEELLKLVYLVTTAAVLPQSEVYEVLNMLNILDDFNKKFPLMYINTQRELK